MDKIKRIISFMIPMSICNFRCSYCYLSQRDKCYQGKQIEYKYSPEHVGKAFSVNRLGGLAYVNFSADGETLLTNDLDKYIYEIVKQGHYIEIVTNLTIVPMLEKILSWDKEILKRITFKCSFHYLELKNKKLLNIFIDNVHKIWNAGASANIEMVDSDDYIPYLDEIKSLCIKEFGALPHITIGRNDKTKDIEYLTKLSIDENEKIWSQFDSDFWKFKKEIFLKKRKEFCYAGDWLLYVNLENGVTTQCYCSNYSQNIFENLNKPIVFMPIGKCMLPHCYNGHMFLTLGCIPNFTKYRYGDIRNRKKIDGTYWLQPELKSFVNTTLNQSNKELDMKSKRKILRISKLYSIKSKLRYMLFRK